MVPPRIPSFTPHSGWPRLGSRRGKPGSARHWWRRIDATKQIFRRTILLVAAVTQARVSLLRWLRRQLAQPTPVREHLEAAVSNDDPREARRLLDGFEFSDAQRRHVAGLIEAWEREVGPKELDSE